MTPLALCGEAADILKACGFGLLYTSMKSEACYYGYPGKHGAIRVAAHRFGRTEGRKLTMPVLACVTFGTHNQPGGRALDGQVALAIGQYFIANSRL